MGGGGGGGGGGEQEFDLIIVVKNKTNIIILQKLEKIKVMPFYMHKLNVIVMIFKPPKQIVNIFYIAIYLACRIYIKGFGL